MPIGVPKVPFSFPGEPYGQWMDIHSRLYQERIIFLNKELDDEIANQIVAMMLYLDSEESGKDIQICINSPGGSLRAGMAIYDTMQCIKSDVVTLCVGSAASIGSFLLAVGAEGKRSALPQARIMLNQPSRTLTQGRASDIKIEAEEILRLRRQVNEVYAQRTGQPLEKVESLAILDYLEAKYPTPPLMPTDAKAIATVRMVEMVTLNELLPAMIRLTSQAMGFVENDPQKLEQAKQKTLAVLKFFENLLGDSPYFGSERLTLADIVAGTTVPQLPLIGVTLDDYPKLSAWSDRLMQRETWVKTQPSQEELEAFIPQMKTLMKAYLGN